MSGDVRPRLHVAAAAIFNSAGEVLISRRPAHVHQGDRWEFPGGKVEAHESAHAALARELHEEVGVDIRDARPLIRIRHDYTDRPVLLDVWRVNGFDGVAHGREGQAIQWVSPEQLHDYHFPEANRPIITAVQLPDCYLITPNASTATMNFFLQVETALANGIRLMQFRDKSLDEAAYCAQAEMLVERCRRHDARLLLNADPALVATVGADGVHLSSQRLLNCRSRPLSESYWVAASCHDARELEHARRIGVDFAVLGPVRQTASHGDTAVLGWDEFARLCDDAPFPVYALGGIRREDLPQAFTAGAQGIAAISGLWPD